MPERIAGERETLIFRSPEQAQEFRENVTEKIREGEQAEVKRPREAVTQAVAAEFEKHGEGGELLARPWEHTEEEHKEAKALVDVAFEKDLGEAIKQARQSKHYPRNIDLLHDVLTSELYEMIVQQGLNKQHLMVWPVVGGVVVIAGLLLMSLLVFAFVA